MELDLIDARYEVNMDDFTTTIEKQMIRIMIVRVYFQKAFTSELLNSRLLRL